MKVYNVNTDKSIVTDGLGPSFADEAMVVEKVKAKAKAR